MQRLRAAGVPVWVTRIETLAAGLRLAGRLFSRALDGRRRRTGWSRPGRSGQPAPTGPAISAAVRDLARSVDGGRQPHLHRRPAGPARRAQRLRRAPGALPAASSLAEIAGRPPRTWCCCRTSRTRSAPRTGRRLSRACATALVSGRLLTWYGPSLVTARAELAAVLPVASRQLAGTPDIPYHGLLGRPSKFLRSQPAVRRHPATCRRPIARPVRTWSMPVSDLHVPDAPGPGAHRGRAVRRPRRRDQHHAADPAGPGRRGDPPRATTARSTRSSPPPSRRTSRRSRSAPTRAATSSSSTTWSSCWPSAAPATSRCSAAAAARSSPTRSSTCTRSAWPGSSPPRTASDSAWPAMVNTIIAERRPSGAGRRADLLRRLRAGETSGAGPDHLAAGTRRTRPTPSLTELRSAPAPAWCSASPAPAARASPRSPTS